MAPGSPQGPPECERSHRGIQDHGSGSTESDVMITVFCLLRAFGCKKYIFRKYNFRKRSIRTVEKKKALVLTRLGEKPRLHDKQSHPTAALEVPEKSVYFQDNCNVNILFSRTS